MIGGWLVVFGVYNLGVGVVWGVCGMLVGGGLG